MSVTISTLNTRSIRYPDRGRTVLGHLTTKPADIFLLQDCGIPYKEMDGLLEEGWTLGSSFWSGSNIARADGVGILMTNPYIRPKASRVVESGRILVLDLEIQGSPLRVINVYGPTNVPERVSLYRKLRSLLLVSTPVLVGGDFNCALRDENRSKPSRDRSSKELQAIIDDFSLTDVGGSTPPNTNMEWWEIVKDRVKGYLGCVGRRKAREKRASFNHHNKALQRLSLFQLEGFEVARELSKTKEHLATLYREEQKKSQYRSKLQGLEEDEKCTRYFFRKARSRQKPILSLYNSQGDSVKNSADILRAAGDFYGRLYDTKPADGDLATAFLEGLNRVIEGGESEDPEMSIEELTRAVHSINKQKAPGLDGIPGEFYQTFWDLIKNNVAEVFQAIYRERRLGESITLIPKKGDLKDLRNWRPINLLYVDYKIMTKALTKRFQSHLPTVIAADQTCSIPERSINDNLLLVRDVILHSQERGSPLGLLSLDQEKAFDRVSHGFLQRVLKKMNFPNTSSTGPTSATKTSAAAEYW
ncbi:hypothetical protein DPEC_G00002400 [Dallia pectoralis]|uniref:Uncharacterized protein n=1 Tax=Dallia pectoralis TaxID=75939 RepID=A0ACC2HK23_DALPE|nr:hypothetical protein DPEC_G00002400 [Dallia pectoralis]